MLRLCNFYACFLKRVHVSLASGSGEFANNYVYLLSISSLRLNTHYDRSTSAKSLHACCFLKVPMQLFGIAHTCDVYSTFQDEMQYVFLEKNFIFIVYLAVKDAPELT